MYGSLTSCADLWGRRQIIPDWNVREQAWLVDSRVATPDERAHAWSPWRAAVLLGWWTTGVPPALVGALEEGTVLLVVRPSGIAPDAIGPPPVELADYAETPPLSIAPPDETGAPEETLHVIEFLVVDALGEPRAGVAYELALPDGNLHTGRTPADGRVRIENLEQTGNCRLTFPEVAAPEAAAA